MRCRFHLQVHAYRVRRPIRLLIRRANYNVQRCLSLSIKRPGDARTVLARRRDIVSHVECICFHVDPYRTVVLIASGRYVPVTVSDSRERVLRRFALGTR